MNRGSGPPDDEGRAPGPPNDEKVVTQPPNTEANTKPQCHTHFNARHPQLGGYAGAWREGWRYGFVDACRLAARNTDDPYVWAMLSRLAIRYGPDEFGRRGFEEYALAGCDD